MWVWLGWIWILWLFGFSLYVTGMIAVARFSVGCFSWLLCGAWWAGLVVLLGIRLMLLGLAAGWVALNGFQISPVLEMWIL